MKDADHLGARVLKLYLEGHLYRQFRAPRLPVELPKPELRVPSVTEIAAHLPTALA